MNFPALNRAACHRTIAVVLFVFAAGLAQAQNWQSNWVTGPRADAFWNLMAKSPYAQSGDRGPVVYMISYSACGNCIVFLRDFWETHKAGMQLREIFAPANQPRFLDEAAEMALTRDPGEAERFYKRSKTAPPANSSPERQAALRRVVEFYTQVSAFYRSLGHIPDSFPTFVYKATDDTGREKLWIISGWGPEYARDLDKLIPADNR